MRFKFEGNYQATLQIDGTNKQLGPWMEDDEIEFDDQRVVEFVLKDCPGVMEPVDAAAERAVEGFEAGIANRQETGGQQRTLPLDGPETGLEALSKKELEARAKEAGIGWRGKRKDELIKGLSELGDGGGAEEKVTDGDQDPDPAEVLADKVKAGYEAYTKDELQAMAKEAEITGSWDMNKEALVENLTEIALERLAEEEGGGGSEGADGE